MRIAIDHDRCMGHGQCEMFGPNLFEVGEDDLAHPLLPEPPSELHAQARDAAERCPESAILVTE